MDSHVSTSELDRHGYSGDGSGPKDSGTDQKQQAVHQPIIPLSVTVLCSSCAQPQWEKEWNFSIEDGVAINCNNNSSFERGDSMKDKAGKGQKMRRNMGKVFYHKQPRTVVRLSP